MLRALRPALATTGGLLAAISSPHAKRGELYTTFKRHFGPTGHPSILVAKAPSLTMNPALNPHVVERAFESDPEAASAEYGAEFRGDIGVFIARDVLESCVARGVIVRPPMGRELFRLHRSVGRIKRQHDARDCAPRKRSDGSRLCRRAEGAFQSRQRRR